MKLEMMEKSKKKIEMKKENNSKSKTLILIGGGTGSGKTTIGKTIASVIKEGGKSVSFLRLDDYYHNQDHKTMEERRKVNYDHPNEFEWDKIYNDIKLLLDGETIKRPEYVHKIMTHDANKKRITNPSDVIILEGIFALYDERIVAKAIIKIFVETDDDIRLLRRIKRNVIQNHEDLETLFTRWTNEIKPMNDQFIAPTKKYADIIIPNTSERINTVAIDIIKTKINDLI